MDYILRTQFGSHVYGTNLPTSDTDYKAIYIPNPRDIILQRVKQTIPATTKKDPSAKNSAEDVDEEVFSLQKYLSLLCEGQTVSLDMLFTPKKFHSHSSPLWDHLVQCRHLLVSRKHVAFVGYCRTQANRYGIRGSRMSAIRKMIELLERLPDHVTINAIYSVAEIREITDKIEHVNIVKMEDGLYYLEVCGSKYGLYTKCGYVKICLQKTFDAYGERSKLAEKNQGVDWKALMHAVRVCCEATELFATGNITFPRPEADLLLKIRKGEMHFKEVQEIIEWRMYALEESANKSTLRDTPDMEFVEEFVHGVYLAHIKNKSFST